MSDEDDIGRMARVLCVADGQNPEEVVNLGVDEGKAGGQTYSRDVLVPAWTTYVSEARRTITARALGLTGVIPSDRFTADKTTIRAELERRARARQTITYGEAAGMVGRSSQGLGKILTAISIEEAGRRRPDLGALVVRVSTGLPSYVKADPIDRARALTVREAVFPAWVKPG